MSDELIRKLDYLHVTGESMSDLQKLVIQLEVYIHVFNTVHYVCMYSLLFTYTQVHVHVHACTCTCFSLTTCENDMYMYMLYLCVLIIHLYIVCL